MNRLSTLVALAGLAATPAQATDWTSGAAAGAFVGARIQMPLGNSSESKAQAGLAVAPVMLRQPAGSGRAARIGRGLELDFAGPRPELRLAGIRADQAVRVVQSRQLQADRKSGLSTGAWVGIAAGVVVVGAVIFVATLTCVGRDRDYCGSD